MNFKLEKAGLKGHPARTLSLLLLVTSLSLAGSLAHAQTVPCLESLDKEKERLNSLEMSTKEEIRVLKEASTDIRLKGEEGLIFSAIPERRRASRHALKFKLSRINEKLAYLQYFADAFDEALTPQAAESIETRMMVADRNGKYKKSPPFPLLEELYASFNKRMPTSLRITSENLVGRLSRLMEHEKFCSNISKVFDLKSYTFHEYPGYYPAENPRSLLIMLLSNLDTKELEGSTGFFEEEAKRSLRKKVALMAQKQLGLIASKEEAPVTCPSPEKDLATQLQEIRLKVEEWDKQNKIFIASIASALDAIQEKLGQDSK